MALKFSRNFKEGRQSEQFLNDELITLYELSKYLGWHKQDHDGKMPPAAKLSGAINAQIPSKVGEDSSLNYWDASQNAWLPFFARKFQITDQLLVQVCPSNPVPGQLWINNGALYYFDGKDWKPVKTVEADDSQWASGAFADFQIVSPLNPFGHYTIPLGNDANIKDEYIYHYEASFTITDPTEKLYATDRIYHSGQSEVTVHLNGILLMFGRDWEEIDKDGNRAVERSTPCKAIGFKIGLQKDDVITYHISRKMLPEIVQKNSNLLTINEDWYQYWYENEIDYLSDNIVVPSTQKWTPDWISPELEAPEEVIITDDYLSQFPIPNLKTDRVFIDNTFDLTYDPISSICFQYKTNRVINHRVSGVHLNPGKLTKITKRLIQVDKINSTIAVSPYNTEFYGFRSGENTGSFLIPSNSQDYGDYIPAGDHIILNYHSNQNYDYVLAITYEFSWMRADGSMFKNTLSDLSNAYYISNIKAPLNLHVNGLKLEEASYDVDLTNKVVRIDDDASNVSVQAWSPYKKQFGYIRETDLKNRGIIRLHEPVHAPLVFVGGTLIHPLYGGLEFEKDKIYVPNSGSMNQMLNMSWCVVDLVSEDMDVQYQQSGHAVEIEPYYLSGPQDRFVPPDEMYYAGTMSSRPDSKGIYDYILSSGTLHGLNGVYIKYDVSKIKPTDGILLFVDGLLIDEKDIERDAGEGVIWLKDGSLTEDQEYVLLKDQDGAIYNSANMIPAFGTGILSESLVYLNGKLLCNSNCVATVKTPAQEIKDGAVDHEVKYFIENEITGEGSWKIYDQYTYTWITPKKAEIADICKIVNSYENMLTSVSLNIDINKDEDEVIIYTFRFANELAGLTEVGTATYAQKDDDNVPLYTVGAAFYGYGQGMLNLWRNGVKMIENVDYEEHPQGKFIRMLTPLEETDQIQFMIEPVEHGYTKGHTFVRLHQDNAIQPNIYKIPDEDTTTLYPGRLTVYVNGIRIPNTDWTLLTNKTIMLKYTDYKAVGSAQNYPDEEFTDEKYNVVTTTHTCPDEILIEIRNDFERQEKTVYLPKDVTLNELSITDYELDPAILESADEILFYLNGQFTGLSRNKNDDYRLDRYKGCIAFMNSDFVEAASKDVVKNLFDQDNYMYAAWKKMTGKSAYTSDKKNALTIVWR